MLPSGGAERHGAAPGRRPEVSAVGLQVLHFPALRCCSGHSNGNVGPLEGASWETRREGRLLRGAAPPFSAGKSTFVEFVRTVHLPCPPHALEASETPLCARGGGFEKDCLNTSCLRLPSPSPPSYFPSEKRTRPTPSSTFFQSFHTTTLHIQQPCAGVFAASAAPSDRALLKLIRDESAGREVRP